MKDESQRPIEITVEPGFPNLTKRELIAAMAMQGFCSNHRYLKQLDNACVEAGRSLESGLAVASASYADALLAELSK